jgi:hypothetical protein
MNLSDIRKGDLFSESSVYTFIEKKGNSYLFNHIASKQTVTLDSNYVEKLLTTADQFDSTVECGKEDKHWTQAQIDTAIKKGELKSGHTVNVGDLRVRGIRTVFEEIGNEVFTCCFTKADKVLSKKAYDAKIAEMAKEATTKIEAAKASKKGVVNAATSVIEELLRNPVLQVEAGEERVLRGYKQQFSSRDGRYNCMDVDIFETRPVNINSLQWIVVNNVKYIVE